MTAVFKISREIYYIIQKQSIISLLLFNASFMEISCHAPSQLAMLTYLVVLPK